MISCKSTTGIWVLSAVLAFALFTVFPGCRIGTVPSAAAGSLASIVDHTVVNEVPHSRIPATAIKTAKSTLHIAYGRTSHGGQVVKGLERLNAFMEGKGAEPGLYEAGFYGNPPAGMLDLYDSPWRWKTGWGDCAYDLGTAVIGGAGVVDYMAWVYTTRKYLGWKPGSGDGSMLYDYATGIPAYDPSNNSGCNVIIWAWCGQLSDCSDVVVTNYLSNMTQLESDYPEVAFVYMTGRVDGTGLQGTLHRHNNTIRAYCRDNGKILYDFEDIESYDLDGKYYGDKYVTDACNYDANGNGVTEQTDESQNNSWPATPLNGDANWALDWQASHVVGADWYECDLQYYHTQHLNDNLKAYAAWFLFARLAGWDGRSN